MQFTDYDGPVISGRGRKADPEILEIERALRRVFETKKPLVISGVSEAAMKDEMQRVRNTAQRLGLSISTGLTRDGNSVIRSVSLRPGKPEPLWRVELSSVPTQPTEAPKPAAKRAGRKTAG